MSDLKTYLDKWSLTGPEKIASTFTSDVYKVHNSNGEIYVLKVLNDVGKEDEAAGAYFLSHVDGQGTARILEFDEGAHLLEFIPGVTLREGIGEHNDLEKTAVIADVVKKMHSVSVDALPKQLVSLERRFASLLDPVIEFDAALKNIFAAGADHVRDLLANPAGRVAIHGDIHHENILRRIDGAWVAIDPKGLVGDPYYEIANTFSNPDIPELIVREDRIHAIVDVFAEKLGFDKVRILRFAFSHSCLSSVWSIEDKQDPSVAIAVAKLIQPMIK